MAATVWQRGLEFPSSPIDRRPIFIVGMGRSGSTLLRLMLHHHPRIAIPYESHFISRYRAELDRFGDPGDLANLRRLIAAVLDEPLLKMWDHGFDPDRTLARVRERNLAGVIRVIYQEYAEGKGKVRWGDKSDYLDDLHVIDEIFPDAQFIHIIRDGRDVARSVMKLPWGPNDLVAAAEWWNDNVWVGRRVGAVLGKGRYTEVRFEDLVQEPERELRRLAAFLGEEYAPEMLDYHRDSTAFIPEARRSQHYKVDSPPDAARAYSWKREMPASDVLIFDRYAGRMLDEVGYERPTGRLSPARACWRLARIYARRLIAGSHGNRRAKVAAKVS